MSGVIKKFPTISPPPLTSKSLDEKGFLTNEWQQWNLEMERQTSHHTNNTNHNALLNPDFHWSRTKGVTPTVADGEFVEQWWVKSNGMTFSITPTPYTQNTYTSDSGSDYYAHISITVENSNDFEIYQKLPNSTSTFQNKNIIITGFARNNDTETVKCRTEIGFDANKDGTPEIVTPSRSQSLQHLGNFMMFNIKTPKVTATNQNNQQFVKYILYDLTAPVDIDLYYLKCEFNTIGTKLYVDHILEQLRIDNAPT